MNEPKPESPQAAVGGGTGLRMQVARNELARTRLVPDPDAPAARALADGEARLRVEHFALTANNVTYAAFGEAMNYWQFFPTGEAAWGCVPVWGFATVLESRVEGLDPGRRLWGYLPSGSHLVVTPGRISAHGFSDKTTHREPLPKVYNHYQFCDADPDWSLAGEGFQAVLKPLFATSFLIDDFLAEQQFFGAQQLLLSSASSKTAFGTAFCLEQRRGQPGTPRIVGLSSPGNLGFCRALGCYDELLAYDQVTTLDPALPTVYIDFAGNAALRRAVHTHFGAALRHSSAIGGTHWDALSGALGGAGGGLPGPRPTLFFAPAQSQKRSAPPPEGWGPSGLQQRLSAAWGSFLARVQQADDPWLGLLPLRGGAALTTAWQDLVAGRTDARTGLMLTPRD
jgi:hypothetical protein